MVDEEVIIDKLEYINEYSAKLKEIRGLSKEEYADDFVMQRAVERMFETLIQASIDLAQHICAAEGLVPSDTAKQAMHALGSAAILSDETQVQMESAVGFRHILAHRYGDVDHTTVYDVLHDDLHWFDRFQQEVAKWYQQYC